MVDIAFLDNLSNAALPFKILCDIMSGANAACLERALNVDHEREMDNGDFIQKYKK